MPSSFGRVHRKREVTGAAPGRGRRTAAVTNGCVVLGGSARTAALRRTPHVVVKLDAGPRLGGTTGARPPAITWACGLRPRAWGLPRRTWRNSTRSVAVRRLRRVLRLAGPADRVLAHLVVEGHAVDPEDARRLGDVAAGVGEHRGDVPLLDLLEGRERAGLRRRLALRRQ